MNPYFFGVTPTTHGRTITAREVERRDHIARQIGGQGCGFEYTRMPEGWRGWYYAPNQGAPFDGNVRAAVLSAVHESD